MFEVFSIKRLDNHMWEVHIENGARKRTQTMSNAECAIYLDKATEIVEDLVSMDHRTLEEDFR